MAEQPVSVKNVSMWPFDPATEHYVSLATYRRNGQALMTPVWLAGHDHRYYLFSEKTAGKVKRIRLNSMVRLAACNSHGKVGSDWLTGDARIVEDPGLIAKAYAALRKKYGWQMALTDFFSKLTGRYQNRAIVEIEIRAGA